MTGVGEGHKNWRGVWDEFRNWLLTAADAADGLPVAFEGPHRWDDSVFLQLFQVYETFFQPLGTCYWRWTAAFFLDDEQIPLESPLLPRSEQEPPHEPPRL